MTYMTEVTLQPAPVKLEDGRAEYMGGGLFVVLQKDQTVRRHKWQNVVVSRSDLATLKAIPAHTVPFDDGTAEYVGDGYWRLLQMDHLAQRMHNVVLSGQDVEALLKAA
ncbi:hypothetical protein EGM87_15985 [Sphingobium sp. RSMS]|uniref:hypothetical protein n=1 Tax=Sphingobium sp. RSMS TaxID=520734 RepID=UPI0010F8564F|nr:hypothetical protein [Sphingobium sp. RSMS]UXC90512.1 hypothetical protein EGM87_15985 [Sphingobium sp. RSMS]